MIRTIAPYGLWVSNLLKTARIARKPFLGNLQQIHAIPAQLGRKGQSLLHFSLRNHPVLGLEQILQTQLRRCPLFMPARIKHPGSGYVRQVVGQMPSSEKRWRLRWWRFATQECKVCEGNQKQHRCERGTIG